MPNMPIPVQIHDIVHTVVGVYISGPVCNHVCLYEGVAVQCLHVAVCVCCELVC